MTDCQAIFTDIYKRKVWGAGSGGGSDRGASQPWADIVSTQIASYSGNFNLVVTSVGCGDGHADSLIDLHGHSYIGFDAVPEMIEFCSKAHPRGTFTLADALRIGYPRGFVLCKEVTQHLSDADVLTLLSKFKQARTIIHCSATNPGDQIAVTGGYRPVWLDRPPFNLKTERLGEWSYGQTRSHVYVAWANSRDFNNSRRIALLSALWRPIA